MSSAFLFLLAPLLLAFLGAGAAFHPSVRGFPAFARLSAAFLAGAVALAGEATLLSMLRVPWSLVSLALPLLTVSLLLAAWWSRSRAAATPMLRFSPSKAILLAASAIAFLAFCHLGLALATSRATSVDYVLFWGVKGVRFAQARGIDSQLLAWSFFSHAVPDYPPLVPIVYAWCVLVAGRMSWRVGVIATGLWLLAAIPLVLACLRRRLDDDRAAVVTAFWTAGLCVSLAHSLSGGGAEAPLLMFETVAGAALLTEAPLDSSRFLPALALMGAALTKVEGLVGAGALVLGAFLRDALERRERPLRRALRLALAPLFGVGLWFAFQLVSGLPVGYRAHGMAFGLTSAHVGTILRELMRSLNAGTLGLTWMLPLVFLLGSRKSLRRVLPGLVPVFGILAFLTFDYMHDRDDPSLRIGWTAPRVSQPALSLWILSAGLAWFSPREDDRNRLHGGGG